MERDNKTIKKITETALRLLEKAGPEKVTMRRVAKAVGITAMAIYHYFPSRDALLRAVTDAEFERIITIFDQQPAHRSAGFRLRRMMESYVDFSFAQPRVFDHVFLKSRPGAARFPRDFRARSSPIMNRAVDTVSEAMRKGTVKKGDAWEVAIALWAHVHGYVTLYRANRFDLSEAEFRALFRRSLKRLLNSLKT